LSVKKGNRTLLEFIYGCANLCVGRKGNDLDATISIRTNGNTITRSLASNPKLLTEIEKTTEKIRKKIIAKTTNGVDRAIRNKWKRYILRKKMIRKSNAPSQDANTAVKLFVSQGNGRNEDAR